MSSRLWTNLWRNTKNRGGLALLLLLPIAVLLLLPTAPPVEQLTMSFPHVTPRRLAQELADFSAHARVHSGLGEWTVEEEKGNYTSWGYSVRYSCGARCSGRAAVLALDEHEAAGPTHTAPRAHVVQASHRECYRVPLLAWPELCDEWETRSEVVSDGADGARLRETGRAGCGAVGIGRGGVKNCAANLLRRRILLLEHLRTHLPLAAA